jgi:hypothetical protein
VKHFTSVRRFMGQYAIACIFGKRLNRRMKIGERSIARIESEIDECEIEKPAGSPRRVFLCVI